MNDADPNTHETPSDRVLIAILRLSAFLCLAGWSWVHFYWEAPYGPLVWSDAARKFAERLGVGWDEFVGAGASDGWVQIWLSRIAWIYLACTVLTLSVRKGAWLQMSGLVLATGMLALLSYAKYVSAQRQLPMFVEHGGQILTPLLLVMALTLGVRHRVTIITAIVAFITTFAGHASYALGLWATPSSFYAMTSVILGVNYDAAQTILRTAGALDFVVCVGILIPATRRVSALYAAAWGFVTAIARPVAGMSWSLHYWGADQFLHETALRAPHWMIPLFLFLLWRKPGSQAEDPSLRPPTLKITDNASTALRTV